MTDRKMQKRLHMTWRDMEAQDERNLLILQIIIGSVIAIVAGTMLGLWNWGVL